MQHRASRLETVGLVLERAPEVDGLERRATADQHARSATTSAIVGCGCRRAVVGGPRVDSRSRSAVSTTARWRSAARPPSGRSTAGSTARPTLAVSSVHSAPSRRRSCAAGVRRVGVPVGSVRDAVIRRTPGCWSATRRRPAQVELEPEVALRPACCRCRVGDGARGGGDARSRCRRRGRRRRPRRTSPSITDLFCSRTSITPSVGLRRTAPRTRRSRPRRPRRCSPGPRGSRC